MRIPPICNDINWAQGHPYRYRKPREGTLQALLYTLGFHDHETNPTPHDIGGVGSENEHALTNGGY